jgi:hypothetical protein
MAAASMNRAVTALRFFARYALEKRLHKKEIAHGLKAISVVIG